MPDEVLYGAAAIGRALGLRPRVGYHRAAAGQLPTFKLGATLCAKRSSVAGWLASRDGVAAAAATPTARETRACA